MTVKPQRIYTIDMLKGICMFFMIIDHWRDNLARMGQTILGSINPIPIYAGLLEHFETASFWLRCTVGYFIAPPFLILAGASCYLWQIRRGEKASLFNYLLYRGLMIAGLNFLIFFNFSFFSGGSITLHVLWPLGIGMILLGCIYKWNKYLLFTLALTAIVGQNLFETISFSSPILNSLWTLAFIESPVKLPWGAQLYNLWPIMPWFSMMLMGYLLAPLFLLGDKSIRVWAKLGVLCLVLFLFLRLTGVYGDPNIWQVHDSLLKTLADIIVLNKYPPSLQFTLYGFGISFLAIALFEKYQITNRMFLVFGSTPLFFYIVHLTLIRVAKFIILRLPANIMDSIKDSLFSFTGLALGIMILTLAMWFLCELYKIIMKKKLMTNLKLRITPSLNKKGQNHG